LITKTGKEDALSEFSVNDLNVVDATIATAKTIPWEWPVAPAIRSCNSPGIEPETDTQQGIEPVA